MKKAFLPAALVLILVSCATDPIAPEGTPEAFIAKGGTPDDPPCDTYKEDVSQIKNCATLKLYHPDSLDCWYSSEGYRKGVRAWETRWAELECDTFE